VYLVFDGPAALYTFQLTEYLCHIKNAHSLTLGRTTADGRLPE